MARRETYQRWSAAEIDYLLENYSEDTALDIAHHLGRTPDSIWEKAGREGLRKRTRRAKEGAWQCPACDKTKPQSAFSKGGLCRECTDKKNRQRAAAQARKGQEHRR